MKNPRLQRLIRVHATVILGTFCGAGFAETCFAPAPPFLPDDLEHVLDYRDIIQRDFDLYITDIEAHFRCLDEERARAFAEARRVSEDYVRFRQIVSD